MTAFPKLSKSLFLLIITLCSLVICYELAFKKTWEAWRLNKHLKEQVDNLIITAQPQYLQRQNNGLSKILALFRADTSNYRNLIINQIANIGDQNKVKVVEVPVQKNGGETKFTMQKIQLKGDFKSLLITLYRLEKLYQLGYIRAVIIKKNNTSLAPSVEQLMDLYFEITK